jgi:hypothetical protein
VGHLFGPEPAFDSLRAGAMTVRREPLTATQQAGLIETAQPPIEAAANSIQSDFRRDSNTDLIGSTKVHSLVALQVPPPPGRDPCPLGWVQRTMQRCITTSSGLRAQPEPC